MVCEPNARMCGWDCKPALHCLRMVSIPFAANQNLSVFCANTKRTGCAGCPFHAPGVLCSPQVRRKLINRALLTRCTQMAQCLSCMLVYTKLYRMAFKHSDYTYRIVFACFDCKLLQNRKTLDCNTVLQQLLRYCKIYGQVQFNESRLS